MAGGGDNVQVAVRVRPFNKREKSRNAKMVVFMDGKETRLASGKGDDRKFTFDYSFWSHDPKKKSKFAGQEDVFNNLGTMVLDNAFNGYNASLLAYGQTGSGKSYTMMGADGEQRGIIPRLSEALFERAKSDDTKGMSYKVELSYLEIYSERIRDLLSPNANKKKGLKVREDPETGPYVDGLLTCAVSSFEELEKLMVIGNKTRTVAATKMNAQSSRSHAVLTITFIATREDDVTNLSTSQTSKIQLVDLAGSERVSKSGVKGVGLREAAMINKSLTTLGMVISSLAKKGGGAKGVFVPYRDSVLTWLLKESLGGNAKTVMIAALSPADINYEETLSTLRYANRMKQILNVAKVNEDPNAALIRQLREEIEALKNRLAGSGGADAGDIKTLRDKLIQNRLDREKERKEWEEKLAAARRAAQMGEQALDSQGISAKRDLTVPHFVNLHEEDDMTEKLFHYIKKDVSETLICSRNQQNMTCIKLYGVGIEPEHCYVRPQKDGSSVSLDSTKKINSSENPAKTFINGKLLIGSVTLAHGDRVAFGAEQIFRFFHPEGKTEEGEEFGWNEAQSELEKSPDWIKYNKEQQERASELEALRKREEDRKRLVEQRMTKKLDKLRRISALAEKDTLRELKNDRTTKLEDPYRELVVLVDEMNAICRALGILGDTQFKLELVSDGAAPENIGKPRKGVIVANYSSEDPTELNCNKDDGIDILHVTKDGHALVQNGQEIGWIPSNYIYPEPKMNLEGNSAWALTPQSVRHLTSSRLEIRAFRNMGNEWMQKVESGKRSQYRCKWDVPLFLQRLKALRRVYNNMRSASTKRTVTYNPTEILLQDELRSVGVASVRMYPLLFSGNDKDVKARVPILDANGNTLGLVEIEMGLELTKNEYMEDEDELRIGKLTANSGATIIVRVVRVVEINSMLLPMPERISKKDGGIGVELCVRHTFWKALPETAAQTRLHKIEWSSESCDLPPTGPTIKGGENVDRKEGEVATANKKQSLSTSPAVAKEQDSSSSTSKETKTTGAQKQSADEIAAVLELEALKKKLKAERNTLLAKRVNIRNLRKSNLNSRQQLAKDISKQRKMFNEVRTVMQKLQARQVKLPPQSEDAKLEGKEAKSRAKQRALQKRLTSKINEIKTKSKVITDQYNQMRTSYQGAQKQCDQLAQQEAHLKRDQVEMQKRHKSALNEVLKKIRSIKNKAAAAAAAATAPAKAQQPASSSLPPTPQINDAEPKATPTNKKEVGETREEGGEETTTATTTNTGPKPPPTKSSLVALKFQPTVLGMIFADFRVLEVRPGTQAHEKGVRKGWSLKKANDTEITEETNMKELFIRFRQIGAPITLVFETSEIEDGGLGGIEEEEDVTWTYRLKREELCGYRSVGLRNSPDMKDIAYDKNNNIIEIGANQQEFIVIERLHDILSAQIYLRLEDGSGWVFALDPRDKEREIVELVGINKSSTTDKENKNQQGAATDKGGMVPRKANSDGEKQMVAAAAHQKFAEVKRLLINQKVDPNVGDDDSDTALHWAVRWGNVETVELLLARKANPNYKGKRGNTALIEACWKGFSDITNILISNNAKVNDTTEAGNTGLHWASWKGHNQIVKTLLAAKAKPDTANMKGRTPLHYAFRQHNNEIITLLQPAISEYQASGADFDEVSLWGSVDIGASFKHRIRGSQMSPEFLANMCNGTLVFEMWMKANLDKNHQVEVSKDMLSDLNKEQLVDKLAMIQKRMTNSGDSGETQENVKQSQKVFKALTARLQKIQNEEAYARNQVFTMMRMQDESNEMDEMESKDEMEDMKKPIAPPLSMKILAQTETKLSEAADRKYAALNGSSSALIKYLEEKFGKKGEGSNESSMSSKIAISPAWSSVRLFVATDVEEAVDSSRNGCQPVRTKEIDNTDSSDTFQGRMEPKVVYKLSTNRDKRFTVTVVQADKGTFILESVKSVRIKYFYHSSDPLSPESVDEDSLPIKKQQVLPRQKLLHCEMEWSKELVGHEMLSTPSEHGDRVVFMLEIEMFIRDATTTIRIEYPIVAKIYKKPHTVERKHLTSRLHQLGGHFRLTRNLEANAISGLLTKNANRLRQMEEPLQEEYQRQHKAFMESLSEPNMRDEADVIFKYLEKKSAPDTPKGAERKTHLRRGSSYLSGNLSNSILPITIVPESNEEVVFREGFLHKKETFGSFKRYFFVLQPPHLYYYKTKEDGKAIGHINLIDASVERVTNNSRHPFAFKISEDKITWILSANNEKEMQEWMEALES